MTIRVCIAGATGWVGRDLVAAVLAAPDLHLAGAVARGAAGQDIGTVLGRDPAGVVVADSVAAVLSAKSGPVPDVLIDYTKPASVKQNVLTAIAHGVNVVIGTSGLTADDYREIDEAARGMSVGVVAAGNFSLTATLMRRFALMAARYIGDIEVIDYAGPQKPDVPSGTGRELAEALAELREPPPTARPRDQLHGPVEARGADIGGIPVHSVRMPGFVLSCEAHFGLPGERLTIRHDAGSSAQPYVDGTLLAARRVKGLIGLRRGLDSVMRD